MKISNGSSAKKAPNLRPIPRDSSYKVMKFIKTFLFPPKNAYGKSFFFSILPLVSQIKCGSGMLRFHAQYYMLDTGDCMGNGGF